MTADYTAFLEAKIKLAEPQGFAVDADEINPALKDFVRAIVQWAALGGRRGIFSSFGLHKTSAQIELARLARKRTGVRPLIVVPLGVRHEFFEEAKVRFTGEHAVRLKFIRTTAEIDDGEPHLGAEHGRVEGASGDIGLPPRRSGRRSSVRSGDVLDAPGGQDRADGEDGGPLIYLTNYESVREGKIDLNLFGFASLDEAAVLRGFGGTKTFREFMRLFVGVRYRFVATATPDPNEFIELLAYSAFLDVMDVGEAKTRFFKRNSEQADQLTIHPHKEKEFWLWVASWALFVRKPSDLGFSDDGYVLPAVDVHWHEIPADHGKAGAERDGQGKMFRDAAIGVSNAAAVKRETLSKRVAKMTELLASDPAGHCILWHDLEAERAAIERAVPDVRSIFGSQDDDLNEANAIDFKHGAFPYLATKPRMSGTGCNFQYHCHWSIHLGIGFKFHDFIQSVHRLVRFGQANAVRMDLIYAEEEREVRRKLEDRWAQHDAQSEIMSGIIREYGLAQVSLAGALKRSMGVDRAEARGERFVCINNDCVDETRRMPTDSVDMIVTSIPFSTQYEYTPSYNDFGHTDNDEHFFGQMDYLTPELLRVLRPGRVCAVHVKDRIVPGGLTGLGFQTVSPFSDATVAHFRRHGFAFLARKTITTDVVRENNQTYRLGWTEQCKDGSRMGAGMPEYILLFRKPPTDRSNGYADVPVVKPKPLCDDHGEPRPFDAKSNWKRPVPGTGYSRARWQLDAHGYQPSSGNRLLTPEELRSLPHEQIYKLWRDRSAGEVYDFEAHVALCETMDHEQRLPSTFMLMPPHSQHPDVWTDVARMRSLNGANSAAGRELHLCPLPLDIVERLVAQFSMPNEIIFDPFMGIGTVPYVAVKQKRIGWGVELSPGYFADAVHYLKTAEAERSIPTLFDLLDAEQPAEAAE